jgi:hypothetical protein
MFWTVTTVPDFDLTLTMVGTPSNNPFNIPVILLCLPDRYEFFAVELAYNHLIIDVFHVIHGRISWVQGGNGKYFVRETLLCTWAW